MLLLCLLRLNFLVLLFIPITMINITLNYLILAKIPSRDAFPSDIFNIHASILERCGKLKLCYFNGSITAFPIFSLTIDMINTALQLISV